MKKLIALAVVASAFASFAEDNVFGCLAIESSAEETIICVPWLQPGTGENIKIEDVIKTSNLVGGDQILYYDGNAYQTWELTNGAWVKAGSVGVGSSAEALKRGNALILKRPGAADRTDKKIYIYGQVANDGSVTMTMAKGTKGSPAYSLIAPPTVGDEGKNTTDLNANASWTNVNAQDYIVLPDMSILVYLDDGNGAKKWGKQIKTRTDKTQPFTIEFDTDKAVVPAGQGAWYVSGVGATTTPSVTWSNLPSVK